MLRDFLSSHITASFWLLLVLISAYITGKLVADVALEFYLLTVTISLSSLMCRSGINMVLGAEEE